MCKSYICYCVNIRVGEYLSLGLGFEVISTVSAPKYSDNSILYTARNIKFVSLWAVCNVVILF